MCDTVQIMLDLRNPADALKVHRKFICDLRDGETVLFWFSGSVHSQVPGERNRLLFKTQGMNIRTSRTLLDETKGFSYKVFSKEVLLYLDPSHAEILRSWPNPWTGKDCQVVHVSNDPVNFPSSWVFSDDGKPYELTAETRGGHLFYNATVPLYYPNPLGGSFPESAGGYYQAQESFSFIAAVDDILDASKPCPTTEVIGWSRSSKWLPWMEMGDKPGTLLYHSSGCRLAGVSELPDVLRESIAKYYPSFTQPPPMDDDRKNETSLTYYKKLKTGEISDPWQDSA